MLPSTYYFDKPAAVLREVAEHVGSGVREDSEGDAAVAPNENDYRTQNPAANDIVGEVTEVMEEGLRRLLAPDTTRLREVMCRLKRRGLKVASWDDAAERQKHWSFLFPNETIRDCEPER